MEELKEFYEGLMENYNEFKLAIKRENPQAYERWKAGGFVVDESIVSMYPDATEVFEQTYVEPEDDEDNWERMEEDIQ